MKETNSPLAIVRSTLLSAWTGPSRVSEAQRDFGDVDHGLGAARRRSAWRSGSACQRATALAAEYSLKAAERPRVRP